jgi:magnesium chelatase family protein
MQNEVSRYLSKISGPLLDRIDLQIEAVSVEYDELENDSVPSETSEDVKKRVVSAQKIQQERFIGTGIRFNAKMPAAMIEKYCPLGKAEHKLVRQAFESMGLSMRAYHKILKIARTIADLAGDDKLNSIHLAEAISYRGLDRKYW